jgi:hypothetical protein
MLALPPYFSILKIGINKIVHLSCIQYICCFAVMKERKLQVSETDACKLFVPKRPEL